MSVWNLVSDTNKCRGKMFRETEVVLLTVITAGGVRR